MTNFLYDVYNKESKERFMSTLDLSTYPPRWWERMFEKSAEFEKYRGKDLYSFTTSEILEFYKMQEYKTLSPLIVANTNLIKYGQWAYNEHLIVDGQNHFEELNNDSLTECISKIKLKNSLLLGSDFTKFLMEMYNDQDKFVFYCLYEGIKGKGFEEILRLRLEDIDTKTKTVKLPTRTMKVSTGFISICELADKETTYITLSESGFELGLKPTDYFGIYKNKSNASSNALTRSIYSTISRNIQYFRDNSSITSKSIRDSGLIDSLNARAKSLNMTVYDMLLEQNHCQDIIDKYQFNLDVRYRFCTEYSDYLV